MAIKTAVAAEMFLLVGHTFCGAKLGYVNFGNFCAREKEKIVRTERTIGLIASRLLEYEVVTFPSAPALSFRSPLPHLLGLAVF
mmetsp:Transcript_77707/g.152099  ORF Transcript_77707/g.152099 Transcript_77707/m.152099 type:complete len:84 (+) Transcript_77707:1204-1455(+)